VAKLAGDILTATAFNAGPTSYVPVLTSTGTNPTLGTGATQAGWWYRVGQLVTYGFVIRFGTTGAAAGTGSYLISLPTPADSAVHTDGGFSQGYGDVVGSGVIRDNSTPAGNATVEFQMRSYTHVFAIPPNGTIVQATNPFTWGASDAISGQVQYVVPALP
jgi:hypothetical protein